jgi:MarR family transcriptional regulator, organic hydroperoxide resistance regulator
MKKSSGHAMDRTLSAAIARTAKAHRQRAGQLLAEIGLHPGQELLLAALWRRDGQSQVELARELDVSAPTVNKIVMRMSDAGLVQRRASSDDNRLARVHLTARSERMRGDVEAAWQRLESRTVQNLTEAERAALLTLLRKVYASLTTQEEDADKRNR